MVDERLSTAAVTRTLIDADASRKRRAEVVDKMAAAYILQGALDRLRTDIPFPSMHLTVPLAPDPALAYKPGFKCALRPTPS